MKYTPLALIGHSSVSRVSIFVAGGCGFESGPQGKGVKKK